MSRSFATVLRLLCVLALLAAFMGCAQEESPTAIVLYVNGEIKGLESVKYDVFAADGDGKGKGTEPKPGPLPHTLVILKGKAARVRVEVTALDANGAALLTQRAYVTFRPDETISAPITLTQGCADLMPSCAAMKSCTVTSSGAAVCGDIQEAPTKRVEKPGDERDWDPAPSVRDGGALDAAQRDAGSLPADAQAAPAGDARVGEDASTEPVDAAPRCMPSRPNGKCNVVLGCGCEEGTHCQARSVAGPECVPVRGATALNHRCESNDDCGRGLVCANSVCRKYCTGADDCVGDCVPLASEILEKVCIERCALGAMCDDRGQVKCVPRKGDPAGEGRCLFSREDCGATNRVCEEPGIGTGACAKGTDSEDCCPQQQGACDLISSCGCREGLSCRLASMSAPRSVCVSIGSNAKARGSLCNSTEECGAGLGCFSGLCAEYCQSDEDCDGDASCARQLALGVGHCRYRCQYNAQNPRSAACAREAVCAKFVGENGGDFCAVQLPTCPMDWTMNGVCDDRNFTCRGDTEC